VLHISLEGFAPNKCTKTSRLQVMAGIHRPSQGKVDQRWRNFMRFQIARARGYFAEAEAGVDYLDVKARWPVW
jgi:phytoene synthase